MDSSLLLLATTSSISKLRWRDGHLPPSSIFSRVRRRLADYVCRSTTSTTNRVWPYMDRNILNIHTCSKTKQAPVCPPLPRPRFCMYVRSYRNKHDGPRMTVGSSHRGCRGLTKSPHFCLLIKKHDLLE